MIQYYNVLYYGLSSDHLVQVDRHSRRLDQELSKFKMELEADNAGITEILEKSEPFFFFLFNIMLQKSNG